VRRPKAGRGELSLPELGYNGARTLMPRRNRAVAGLCIAVIAVSVVLPGIFVLDYAIVEPQWILLPDDAPVSVDLTVAPADEQPLPLGSLLPSRSPPVRLFA
jgi:hypothetical protein